MGKVIGGPGVIATVTRACSVEDSGPGHERDVGIDLADKKQIVVVTDHDAKLLAAQTFRAAAWDHRCGVGLGRQQRSLNDFVGVTVAWLATCHRGGLLGQFWPGNEQCRSCVSTDSDIVGARSED